MKEIIITLAVAIFFLCLCVQSAGWCLERTQRQAMIEKATSSTHQATVACDRASRLDAAMLHYKAGCYLTALGICNTMPEPAKFNCYRKAPHECEVSSLNYRRFLGQ